MCGIAGILTFDDSPVKPENIKRMTDVIAHRGPDNEGQYLSGAVGLGHRRLAIIDLSPGGNQPMSNEDSTVWITYNGTIYNYLELRNELIGHGHKFRSSSDTEVIIHAYEEWGVGCLQRFNGMFGFALWDEHKQNLWLARDRIGIKPLFYANLHNSFVFGSEAKSILEYPNFNRSIDIEALAYYLALNYTPAPFTLFEGIRQLLPGHYLTVSSAGKVQDVCYWDLVYQEGGDRKEKEYLEEFSGLLEDAVRLRLVSDVKFGAFLSGGLDSNSVAYYMARNLTEPLNTFSIGFKETSFNELDHAQMGAKNIQANHHERIVTAASAQKLPLLVWHSEEPTADSSMVAVYSLAQLTRKHVTMVLSGDGADETIAGYETYKAFYIHQLYSRLPGWLRKHLIVPLANALPMLDSKVSWDQKVKRFVAAGDLSSEEAHTTWRMIFYPEMRKQLLTPLGDSLDAQADVVDLYRKYFEQTNAHNSLNRLLYVDTRFYLPNDMLVKIDRMTMAHSLEARVPFLDHRLVEFLASVPPRYKLKGYRHKKHLLRTSMRDKLPRKILCQKKQGFNVPNARWIKHELKPLVMDSLSQSVIHEMGILNAKTVEKILEAHFANKVDNSHQIWCLLTLSFWWQQFIAKRKLI